jgi:ESF2/ABP1 family protein
LLPKICLESAIFTLSVSLSKATFLANVSWRTPVDTAKMTQKVTELASEEEDSYPSDMSDEEHEEYAEYEDLSEGEKETEALEVDDLPIAELKRPLLDKDELLRFKEQKDKTGVVYVSRIPPALTPSNLRQYLAPFGAIGRVYLAPNDQLAKQLAKRNKGARHKSIFTEGWVEFMHRKHAKIAVEALNGRPMAGRRGSRFREDLWCIKYLGGDFKWSNLTERISYENAVREQKLRQSLDQARRENKAFLRQVDQAKILEKIEQKRSAKRLQSTATSTSTATATSTDSTGHLRTSIEELKSRFRQRKPINAPGATD